MYAHTHAFMYEFMSVYIDSLSMEREALLREEMSAVKELGTLKTKYRNLKCTHFVLAPADT